MLYTARFIIRLERFKAPCGKVADLVVSHVIFSGPGRHDVVHCTSETMSSGLSDLPIVYF